MSRKLSKKQISYRLGMRYVNRYVEELLSGKQSPDKITFLKQWDEFGYLKGWLVYIIYFGIELDLEIDIDITPYYGRINGDIDKIPEFIPGKHQYWDYDEEKYGKTPQEKFIKDYENML